MEIVTTRITEALPITRPSAVRKVRILFAWSACRLNRRDSVKFFIPDLRSRNFFEHLFREFARRIVRGQIAFQVLLQQILRLIQVSTLLDVSVSMSEHDVRRIWCKLFGFLKSCFALLIA